MKFTTSKEFFSLLGRFNLFQIPETIEVEGILKIPCSFSLMYLGKIYLTLNHPWESYHLPQNQPLSGSIPGAYIGGVRIVLSE